MCQSCLLIAYSFKRFEGQPLVLLRVPNLSQAKELLLLTTNTWRPDLIWSSGTFWRQHCLQTRSNPNPIKVFAHKARVNKSTAKANIFYCLAAIYLSGLLDSGWWITDEPWYLFDNIQFIWSVIKQGVEGITLCERKITMIQWYMPTWRKQWPHLHAHKYSGDWAYPDLTELMIRSGADMFTWHRLAIPRSFSCILDTP